MIVDQRGVERPRRPHQEGDRRHRPEAAERRRGLPSITHLIVTEPTAQDRVSAGSPSAEDDAARKSLCRTTAAPTGLAESGTSPEVFAERLAVDLYPVVLPYRLGTPAAFTRARFNGRALGDDGMTLMLTSRTNTPFGDGARPDAGSFLEDFPYLGVPTSSEHTSS
jgi:hypothetical protein